MLEPCGCLSDPGQSGYPESLMSPAPASSNFSSISEERFISPQQLLLTSDFNASWSWSPATTASPSPPPTTLFFDSPEPKNELYSSPTTTNDSPGNSFPTPQTPAADVSKCPRCVFKANDAAELADHIVSHHHLSRKGPFTCGASGGSCGGTFKDKRTLERHLIVFHFEAVYQCRCGRGDRKDAHKRHIRACVQLVEKPYLCPCGNRTDSTGVDALVEHEEHIKECGKRRRGRPPKNSTR